MPCAIFINPINVSPFAHHKRQQSPSEEYFSWNQINPSRNDARKHYFQACQPIFNQGWKVPQGYLMGAALPHAGPHVNEKCKLVRLPLPIAAFRETSLRRAGKNI